MKRFYFPLEGIAGAMAIYIPQRTRFTQRSHYREEKTLYYSLGNGTLRISSNNRGSGLTERIVSRRMTYGDLLNDGSLDIVIQNLNSYSEPAGQPRDAIGARAEVKAGALDQIQKVHAIEVRWPSGKKETFAVKDVNRIIERRKGTVEDQGKR